MTTPVRGKDAFLWVERDGDYILTVCAKSIGFDVDVEDINTSTVDSGTDTYYKAGYSSATVTLESLGTLDELAKYQFEEFIENRRVIHQLKLVYTNTFGDVLQYIFKAKVRSISMGADVKAFLNGSITLAVCGPLTKTKVINGILDGFGNPTVDPDGHPIRS